MVRYEREMQDPTREINKRRAHTTQTTKRKTYARIDALCEFGIRN